MSATALGALATAGLLGVTHAVEPDHVAGISALTSEYADPRRSALVGACFSLGHAALVVAWLVGAAILLGRAEFPAVYGRIGTAAAGLLLGVLGAGLAVAGLRRALARTEHRHGETSHSHRHVSLPVPGFDGHAHDETTTAYLRTGLVGALFTLSPPVSMMLFATALLPDHGAGVAALAVATYAVAITLAMSAIGAGVGSAFARTRTRDGRLHAAAQTAAGVAVVALAGSLLLDATGLAL